MLKYALPALAIIASPAAARDWPSAGGWDVGEVGTDMCGMVQDYEGEGSTQLALGLRTDGSVLMTVSNYGWSATKDQAYDLVFFLNDMAYDGGKSIGHTSGLRKGFVTRFQPDFLTHFAASTYLTVESKDGVTIDDLTLDGSAAGLAQVRRCVSHLQAVAAADAREKAKLAHIPKDPFAVVEGAPVRPPAQATTAAAVPAPSPRADLASLITGADYPEAARAGGEEGTTRVRLTVDAGGRATGCTVTASSGSSSLDAAACRLLRSRARFTPARDASGRAHEGVFETGIPWRLQD